MLSNRLCSLAFKQYFIEKLLTFKPVNRSLFVSIKQPHSPTGRWGIECTFYPSRLQVVVQKLLKAEFQIAISCWVGKTSPNMATHYLRRIDLTKYDTTAVFCILVNRRRSARHCGMLKMYKRRPKGRCFVIIRWTCNSAHFLMQINLSTFWIRL